MDGTYDRIFPPIDNSENLLTNNSGNVTKNEKIAKPSQNIDLTEDIICSNVEAKEKVFQNDSILSLRGYSTIDSSLSKSHSFAYDISKDPLETTEQTSQTYTDGYFNSSLDKLYARYLGENQSNSGSREQEPTGCFDKTNDVDDGKSTFERCSQKQLLIISTTVLSMIVAATVATVFTMNAYSKSPHHYHGQAQVEESAEKYQHAAIVTSSSLCTKIGTDILRKNGSSVDAAIASCFCLCVANKHSTSIGGGGYMLIYSKKNNSAVAYDFSSAAPGKAKVNMYDTNTTKYGGKYIAVPGLVKGLYEAWKHHGVLSWKDLVQPAYNLTKYGILIQVRSHEIAEIMKNEIGEDLGLRKLLLSTNREPFEPGHLLIDPALSKTFKKISEEPEDFYSGELAVDIVKDVNKAGGLISLDDMANYKIHKRDVIMGNIDPLKLYTIGAPTGGPVVIEILNILKGYHFKEDDTDIKDNKRTALTYHRIIEAMKFAFADRTKEGDPEFSDKDKINDLINKMTDEDVGEKFRQKINDTNTKNILFYEPEYSVPTDSGTSHVSIIAPDGDAVSLTSTINGWYGNMYRSTDTGIIYNNQMKDFSTSADIFENLPPSIINSVHGGKRPLSSITPVILTNKQGKVKFVLGGAGGIRIIPAIAQVIINKLWLNYELGEAVSHPRFYHTLNPNKLFVEASNNLDEKVLELLRERNHTIIENNELEYSAVQAIYVDDEGDIHVKSDYRKYGHSDGF